MHHYFWRVLLSGFGGGGRVGLRVPFVNGSQPLYFLQSTYCRQYHAIISIYITECGSICLEELA